MKNQDTKKSFFDAMVSYMIEEYEVEVELAVVLAFKYIDGIDTEKSIVQHIGYDYFAIQILMVEGIIPYQPI